MPKLVKVAVKLNVTCWSTTAIAKTQTASRASDADAKRFDGIPRDELDRLTDEFMTEHAWLLNELTKR